MKKRNIQDYDCDLLALIDITKAMKVLNFSFEVRKRVLDYIVKRELGQHYNIVRSPNDKQ